MPSETALARDEHSQRKKDDEDGLHSRIDVIDNVCMKQKDPRTASPIPGSPFGAKGIRRHENSQGEKNEEEGLHAKTGWK